MVGPPYVGVSSVVGQGSDPTASLLYRDTGMTLVRLPTARPVLGKRAPDPGGDAWLVHFAGPKHTGRLVIRAPSAYHAYLAAIPLLDRDETLEHVEWLSR